MACRCIYIPVGEGDMGNAECNSDFHPHAVLCATCRTRVEWTPSGMVTCPKGHTRLFRITQAVFNRLSCDEETGNPIYPEPGTIFDYPISNLNIAYGRKELVVWCRKCRAVVEDKA